MKESDEDSLSALRSKMHTDIHSMREKSRDSIRFDKRRLSLEAVIEGNSLKEVKGFLLELSKKKKKYNFEVLKKIKNSCRHPEFIEGFFKINGAFDSLIPLLKSHDAQVQLEVVAVFTNLACGPHKLCFRVAKSVGAYLVSFITSSSHYLQAQSAWAVRNIANDCLECYSRLKSQGVFPALLKALQSPMIDVTESVVYALSACLKYGDLDLVDISGEKYTNTLLKLIGGESLPPNTVREAAFALSNSLYIAVGVKHDCKYIDLLKIIDCLEVFLRKDYMTAVLLIRCLGYLTSYDWVIEYLQSNIRFHAIAFEVFKFSSSFLRREFMWVMTNMSEVFVADNPLFKSLLNTYIKGFVFAEFLHLFDSAALPVLYYVCCSASQNPQICSLYQRYRIVSHIQGLTNCRNLDIANASKQCLAIILNELENIIAS